jgi:hypothetical protein
MILLIILLVLVGVYLYNIIFAKRIPTNTVLVFTGTMGSGKSFLGVKQTIKHYKKMKLLYLLKLIKDKPSIYSNIPLYLGKKWFIFGQERWANVLTVNHLVGEIELPQYCSIFIDEIGDVADQYQYDNPLVQQFIQRFLRYYRHWIDGQIVIASQSIDDLAKPLRSKVSQVYNLQDFRRYLLFFYKVNVNEITLMEDTKSMNTIQTEQEFFFGFPLPFKYLKRLNKILFPLHVKYYDSRCYSVTYKPPKNEISVQWAHYKTDYIIDVPKLPQLKKEFKEKQFIPLTNMTKYLEEWQKIKSS